MPKSVPDTDFFLWGYRNLNKTHLTAFIDTIIFIEEIKIFMFEYTQSSLEFSIIIEKYEETLFFSRLKSNPLYLDHYVFDKSWRCLDPLETKMKQK